MALVMFYVKVLESDTARNKIFCLKLSSERQLLRAEFCIFLRCHFKVNKIVT